MDIQKRANVLYIFSTSFVLAGKDPLDRKEIYGSNQLNLSIKANATIGRCSMLSHSNNSTKIIREVHSSEDKAKMANESAWLF